jgi:hypothetical protein
MRSSGVVGGASEAGGRDHLQVGESRARVPEPKR